MLKTDINDTSMFASEFGGRISITHMTIIEFYGYDVLLSFNDGSTLYDERNFEGKHHCKPPANNCRWEKDKWTYSTERGEFRRGIGENQLIMKATLDEARAMKQ